MITATYAMRNIMTRMEIEKKLEKSQKTIRRLEKKIRDLEKSHDLQSTVAELEKRIANLEARPICTPITITPSVPWDDNPGWPTPEPFPQPWAQPYNPRDIITTCQAQIN
jgi:uncharacterized coiled-coil protein SlyX